ncbi:hypothetical protein GCM10009679_21390 [Saccharothrix algeriensis]
MPAQLHRLRLRAGAPSYRQLAAAGRRTYAASTIADTLNGRRKAVAWQFVHFFVSACLAHAERYAIPLAPSDTDFSRWWQCWLAAEHQPAGCPAAADRAGARP